jgi:hypothetical protein
MTMSNWLIRHLETIGALGPDRVGRSARLHHCNRCGRYILTGLDNDLCALVAHADPIPLSPLGEALALIGGRSTYTLHQMTGRLELQARHRWQIEGSPAGTRYDVLPAHSCDAVNLPTAPSFHEIRTAVPLTEPPY